MARSLIKDLNGTHNSDDDQHGEQAGQNEIRPIRQVVFRLLILVVRRHGTIPLINVLIVIGRLIRHDAYPRSIDDDFCSPICAFPSVIGLSAKDKFPAMISAPSNASRWITDTRSAWEIVSPQLLHSDRLDQTPFRTLHRVGHFLDGLREITTRRK